ncbi:glycosyltransferase family 2 protein [Rhizobium rhizogenes]|uniref:glycosyltransferase family 2 protein n=1 Tax=Rhizobium rhizogenes TaxID=359 RepID=UPI0022CBE037|nr:glycosyltransferase family 2 protein [Rhizobium rhizogenes]MCZ7466948.1 glycosyltransferase [Rhizobium rhizogenes]
MTARSTPSVQTVRAATGTLRMRPVFTGWNRMAYRLGIGGWLVTLGYFWIWWLDRDRVIDWPYYTVVTLTLAWITLLPSYFIFIFLNARVVDRRSPLPKGRVAMVVTKAPSEPFAVVRKTLLAMLDQRGMEQKGLEFDVWLADEDPDAQTLAWCGAHGVFVSTRKGVFDYHRKTWPRRTRCKEGNLAYFYDHYGYERYDFVAQFDADHVPEPDYLSEIIRPFADPSVGYVSAPSICDANAGESWAARGRLYAEASLHGALQLGYNNGWAPLCIGSHYAVRTKALREVGGLGPELAEDHSTTLLMNAGGWRGVHAVNAIAHGDGPATFADLIVQEFQWSRSLMTILLQYSRHYVPKLPLRLKFQFLFSQLWYPLFSGFMALMFVLPVVALLRGQVLVNASYPAFLAHFLPISLIMILFAFFWRATGAFRPHDAKLFSWEAMVFLFLRWPWSLMGVLAAIRDTIRGDFVDFRITPKGTQAKPPLPLRVIVPYMVLAAVSLLAMVLAPRDSGAEGFFIFGAINVAIYAGLSLFLLIRHAMENGLPRLPAMRGGATAAACSLLLVAGSAAELSSHAIGGLEALSHGQPYVTFTETRFTVAGAGVEGARSVRVKLRITLPGLPGHREMQAEPAVAPSPTVATGEIMLADNRVGQ